MTPHRIARLNAICALLFCIFTAAQAAADGHGDARTEEKVREASTNFQRAIELYKEADYQAALIEFKRAYSLAPSAGILYNIGQTEYQLQKYADALVVFQEYLARGSTAHEAEVASIIAVLRTRIGRLQVTTTLPGADIQVDDETVGKAPLSKAVTVSIGHRKVTAMLAGNSPITKWVDVASGENVAVNFEFEKKTEEGAKTATRPTGSVDRIRDSGVERPRTLIIAGWIATAALAAGSAVTGLLAIDSSRKLSAARNVMGAQSEIGSRASTTTALAITADTLGVVAVVMGGLSLYWTVKTSPTAQARAEVSLTGVRLTGTF